MDALSFAGDLGTTAAVLLIAIPTLIIALWYAYRIEFNKGEVDEIQATLRERRT